MLGKQEISNADDLIDSRDVIERIGELEAIESEDRDGEEQQELAALKALEDEASGSGDWQYGETLIRNSYFETYAQDLAEDLGYTNREQSWPFCHIDWSAAADALKADYTSIEFSGQTYWIRS